MKVIAESASNHQGDFQYLLKLADATKYAGADFFTVQVLEINSFCDATYKSREVVEKVVFSQDKWLEFFAYCKKKEIALIPCAADVQSLKFCLNQGFKLIKLHGTDLLNVHMLEVIAKSDVKVLVETQLATERDINLVLEIIGKEKVAGLLHGYSNYPTEESELNLNAIDYMKETWKLPVGFADHTTDTTVVPMMVMAKGAEWLEKHITMSRNDRRYDWQPSLNPEEFRILMTNVALYKKTLGKGIKHPTSIEVGMRQVMYKRYIHHGEKLSVIRADHGPDYYEHLYSTFDSNKIVTAVIARLKSTRLTKKVLRHFHNDGMVFDLITYVNKAKSSSKTILATSYVDGDDELVHEAQKRNIPVYRGHPMIVIDRLLDIAEKEKARAVFRITGDMPFADPELMDQMASLMKEHQLDYVRVMNFPLGMSAELIDVNYLQKLYQRMSDPNESEYLGWFVILDRNARKGCLKIHHKGIDLSRYSLTVDYQADMDRCHNILKAIGKDKMTDITIKDLLKNLPMLDKVDEKMVIKLPGDTTMSYSEFVKMQWDQGFIVQKEVEL